MFTAGTFSRAPLYDTRRAPPERPASRPPVSLEVPIRARRAWCQASRPGSPGRTELSFDCARGTRHRRRVRGRAARRQEEGGDGASARSISQRAHFPGQTARMRSPRPHPLGCRSPDLASPPASSTARVKAGGDRGHAVLQLACFGPFAWTFGRVSCDPIRAPPASHPRPPPPPNKLPNSTFP